MIERPCRAPWPPRRTPPRVFPLLCSPASNQFSSSPSVFVVVVALRETRRRSRGPPRSGSVIRRCCELPRDARPPLETRPAAERVGACPRCASCAREQSYLEVERELAPSSGSARRNSAAPVARLAADRARLKHDYNHPGPPPCSGATVDLVLPWPAGPGRRRSAVHARARTSRRRSPRRRGPRRVRRG